MILDFLWNFFKKPMKNIYIPDPTGAVNVLIEQGPHEKVTYLSKFAVDGDGSGSSHGDPDYQPDTSLHVSGKPLNSDIDLYGVIPPQVVFQTSGIMLGCLGKCTNKNNGKTAVMVCGDVGPHDKVGEGSIALAKALGISSSPVSGGVEDHVFLWEWWPGVPAPGYQLQKS
jgi:hypothetical protein